MGIGGWLLLVFEIVGIIGLTLLWLKAFGITDVLEA
jgi:hypothetical protein